MNRARLRWAIASFAVVGFCHSASAQDAAEETVKETSRQISDAIARRIGAQVQQSIVAAAVGGSAKAKDESSGSLWLTTLYNDLDFKGTGGAPESDLDIYQTIVGGDLRFDRIFVGLSGAYSYSVSKGLGAAGGLAAVGGKLKSDTYVISPYIAYLVTENFFPLAIFSYSYDNQRDSSISSRTIGGDISANYANLFGSIDLRGKAGYRFGFSNVDDAGVGDDTSTGHAGYIGGTLGYRFDSLMPFATAQFEHDFSSQPSGAPSTDRNFLYLTLGLEWQATPSLAISAAFQAETINSDSNNLGGILNVRWKF